MKIIRQINVEDDDDEEDISPPPPPPGSPPPPPVYPPAFPAGYPPSGYMYSQPASYTGMYISWVATTRLASRMQLAHITDAPRARYFQ